MATDLEAQMGIYLEEKDKVILNCGAFGPYVDLRDAPQNKF